jgi:thymidylate synthase
MNVDTTYLALVREILDHGELREDRTGVGTRSIFGAQMRFDLRAGAHADCIAPGFPLLTTKKVHFPAVVKELLGFVAGKRNVRDLGNIWAPWARRDGDLGPVYGVQWRRWLVSEDECPACRGDSGTGSGWCSTCETWGTVERTMDQLALAIHLIKLEPTSRRILVSAWNVAELDKMALMPCHVMFQFYVGFGPSPDVRSYKACTERKAGELEPGWTIGLLGQRRVLAVRRLDETLDVKVEADDGGTNSYLLYPHQTVYAAPPLQVPQRLDCHMYQRSADMALGVPFNIASYALLLSMVANECGLEPGYFIHSIGDAHVYLNHVEGLRRQLDREPLPAPGLRLPVGKAVDDIVAEDIELVGYDAHPAIKFDVAV